MSRTTGTVIGTVDAEPLTIEGVTKTWGAAVLTAGEYVRLRIVERTDDEGLKLDPNMLTGAWLNPEAARKLAKMLSQAADHAESCPDLPETRS